MTALPGAEYLCSHLCADKTRTTFKWSLGNWSLLEDSYVKTRVTSPQFQLNNGIKCKLMLAGLNKKNKYINGTYVDEAIFVLMCEETDSIPILVATISVSYIDEDMNILLTKHVKENYVPKTVVMQLCHNDAILHYLREDTLTVLCEIIIVSGIKESSDIEKSNFSIDITKRFNEMYINQELCDVTIIVEELMIRAHKVVLAAHSNVLKQCLKGK